MKTIKKILSGALLSAFVMGVFVFANSAQASAWTWSGGLKVWNKTNGSSLSTSSFKATTGVGSNIVFSPEGLGPNAHHFTVIMKDNATGQVVFYQTMKTKWSIENPLQDGTLGWTTFKKGSYWMQVNAYQANGVGAGAYYATLKVQ